MKQYRSTYTLWLWFLFDGLLWIGTLAIGLMLRFRGDVPGIEWVYYGRLIPLSTAGLLFSYLYTGVYRKDLGDQWKWTSLWRGWLGGVFVSFMILFFVQIPYSRSAFFLGGFLFLGLDVATRSINQYLGSVLSDNPQSVLALGFPEGSGREELRQTSDSAQFIFRSLDLDDPSFPEIQECSPDFVLVNGKGYTGEKLRELQDFGSRLQVPVRVYPSSEQEFFSQSNPVNWQGIRLLRSSLHYRLQQQMAVKTVFDYFFGFLLLCLSLPIQIGVALSILLLEGRPVLYLQERTGRSGGTFPLYKFRTMVPDAEKKGPELTEGMGDPRITTLGRILRRWSLDELPQLWNVLRGEMSLVGPRPELPTITSEYDPDEKRLLWLKPGLTGLSQIQGRQNLDLDKKLKIDQQYLADYSVGLDLWILLRTFWTVISGRGAA